MPHVVEESDVVDQNWPQKSKFEVVIIGAGPAGLVLAQWMAHTGISALLVDKEDSSFRVGRADGLEPRSLEILESFGLANQVWAESVPTMEFCFWGEPQDGPIRRMDRRLNFRPGDSRFHETTLGQGRVEQVLLHALDECPHVSILRGVTPMDLAIDHGVIESNKPYPISLQLRKSPTTRDASEGTAKMTTIKAKFVVGCDGAHSWTRDQIGGRMEGTRSNALWGAIDLVPTTDFPDIRCRCVISTTMGTMMIIPRERNMVRMYVPLSAARVPRDRIDAQLVLRSAQNIMKPYSLSAVRIEWSTTYEVSQSLSDRYSLDRRIYLVGDAVHVHSPKAGQGMNVSMQDSYNLGWKLAQVLGGTSRPEILDTYEAERRPIATALLEFDARFNECFERQDTGGSAANVRLEKTLQGVTEEHLDISPLMASYSESMAQFVKDKAGGTAEFYKNPRGKATSAAIGRRLPDVDVVRHSDARTLPILKVLCATGHWRILVFAGDISRPDKREQLYHLAKRFSKNFAHQKCNREKSPPENQSVKWANHIDMILCHSASRHAVDLGAIPELFQPIHKDGGRDYDKVFCDEGAYDENGGHAYEKYGIDCDQGALILVRPDQVVAWTCRSHEVEQLETVMRIYFCT